MNKQKLYTNVVYRLTYSVLKIDKTYYNYSYCIISILNDIEKELNSLYSGRWFTKSSFKHKCTGITITNGYIFASYGRNCNHYFDRIEFI